MKRLVCAVLLALLTWPAVPAEAGEALIISGAEDSIIHDFIFEEVLREAYARAGLTVGRTLLPGVRSLRSSNGGETDGEMGRVAGIEDRYPNLVRVPVVVMRTEIVAFALRATEVWAPGGWGDLLPYEVAIPRAILIIEKRALEHGLNFRKLDTVDQMMRTLLKGRYQVAVTDKYKALVTLAGLRREGVSVDAIEMLSPPLITVNLYHYLHRKNFRLLPRLTKALEAMEGEGIIEARIGVFVRRLTR